MRSKFSPLAALMLIAIVGINFAEASTEAAAQCRGLDVKHQQVNNDIGNTASLQRGARNFMSYCVTCHSLKYNRYSRIAKDLGIPDAELDKFLVLPNVKKTDYVTAPLSASDGEAWFGKAPPDLSLIARSRGPDYVYQYLTSFYADAGSVTGVNNLVLPGTAMPHVLSSLQGVPDALRCNLAAGQPGATIVISELVPGVVGQLDSEQYIGFVRDTVNFLDYAGEPTKALRTSLGVWVILFLLVFTGFAYLLKQEYWRDIK